MGGSFAQTTGKRPRTMDDDEDDLGKEARRATVCVEAINQAGQHCYDTGKHFFPGANAGARRNAPSISGRSRLSILQSRCLVLRRQEG